MTPDQKLASRAAQALSFAQARRLDDAPAFSPHDLVRHVGWSMTSAVAVLRHLEAQGAIRRVGLRWVLPADDAAAPVPMRGESQRERVDRLLAAEEQTAEHRRRTAETAAEVAAAKEALANADDAARREFWSKRFDALRR